MAKICEKCKTQNQDNAVFCQNCEKKLNSVKLKNKKFVIIICSIILALFIIGIGITISSSNNSIVGSWADSDGNVRFSFYEDGTCEGGQGPYYEAAENGAITFYDSYHYPYDRVIYYEVHGNKLYLSPIRDFDINDENTIVFYRE